MILVRIILLIVMLGCATNGAFARGATLFLLGDSISFGFGLQRFPDAIPYSDPLYPLRSIWSIGNTLLEENGAPAEFAYLYGITVDSPERTIPRLTEMARTGVIKSGDWLIIEDAGPNDEFTPDSYEQNLVDTVRAVTSLNPKVNVMLMTMFDYAPAPSNSQWDLKYNGKSFNDAIRKAAQRTGAVLLDMNAIMDNWKNIATSSDGISVIRYDGIHPLFWGQMIMVGRILEQAGYSIYISSVQSVWRSIDANWQTLPGSSATWTKARAYQYTVYTLWKH